MKGNALSCLWCRGNKSKLTCAFVFILVNDSRPCRYHREFSTVFIPFLLFVAYSFARRLQSHITIFWHILSRYSSRIFMLTEKSCAIYSKIEFGGHVHAKFDINMQYIIVSTSDEWERNSDHKCRSDSGASFYSRSDERLSLDSEERKAVPLHKREIWFINMMNGNQVKFLWGAAYRYYST